MPHLQSQLEALQKENDDLKDELDQMDEEKLEQHKILQEFAGQVCMPLLLPYGSITYAEPPVAEYTPLGSTGVSYWHHADVNNVQTDTP